MTTFGPYPGVVDVVHDGDTIDVRLDVGFDLTMYARVRVFGVNAPELATVEGKAAREFARGLIPPGALVSVVSHGWDKYGGRIDGELLFGGKSFGDEMVRAGHAKPWDGKGVKP